jgi:hypothetical protein
MHPTFRFAFWLAAMLIAPIQTYPGQGGAQIQKPFQRNIGGAVCFTGTGPLAGNAYFHFPTQDKQALAFTIGTAAPHQEKNEAFSGPGTYTNIGIFIRPESGESVFGYGEVVVSDDGRSGTFSFKTGDSAGEKTLKQNQNKDAPQKPQKDKKKDNKKKDDDSGADDDDTSVAAGGWDCGRKIPY